jgi:N-acetylglutamate synthase-like GNAT family acetyltransferase
MLVIPKFRGQFVGNELLSYCKRYILNDHDFCFAYPYLERYYSNYGFLTQKAEELPEEIGELYNRYVGNGKALTAMQFIG